MKRDLIFICLAFSLSSIAQGQESKDYKRFKDDLYYKSAYIVYKNGDRVKGLIKEKDEIYSNKIVFIPINGEKRTFFPNEISEFGTLSDKYVSNEKLFFEVIKEGKKVSLYRTLVWKFRSDPSNLNKMTERYEDEDFYIKRSSETEFKQVKGLNFKVKFGEYFADCVYLKAKIEMGEYTIKDIEKIVYSYNWECK